MVWSRGLESSLRLGKPTFGMAGTQFAKCLEPLMPEHPPACIYSLIWQRAMPHLHGCGETHKVERTGTDEERKKKKQEAK